MRKQIKELQNENKGFSLVELIIVIAIMAVLMAVLAPALLQYVEKSRAQKDDSAMGEVANAVLIAMSDQNIYDEMLYYTISNNWSCYTDGEASTRIDANKISGAGKATYETYNDQTRLQDETAFKADGTMRGVTITFNPVKNGSKSIFTVGDALVNDIGSSVYETRTLQNVETGVTNGVKLSEATAPGASGNKYLFNQLRSVIGDTIQLTSQSYRNSSYTVFIRMGTTGGRQASVQDAISVYGQWNGTNLPANVAAAGAGAGAGAGGEETP
jgi:type IV pilus assembly protein PilA